MIKPFHKNVLVEKVLEERKTASGIFLGTTEEEKIFKCVVYSVGPETKLAQVGQTLILSRFSRHTEVKHNGKDFLIVHEDDIIGAIE